MTTTCLPFDTAPKRPVTKAPAGACDCHAHVIEPQTVQPYVANRSYTPPPASLEDYKNMHRTLGIERAVIVQPSVYGTDNRVTLRAIERYGPNCRGVAVVDGSIPEGDIIQLHLGGIRGVRFNLVYSGGVDVSMLEVLAGRVKDLGWHLQLFIGAEGLCDLENRLRDLPVPIVIDHMGMVDASKGTEQPAFKALLRLVDGGKTWVKLCGNYRISDRVPNFEDAMPIARKLIQANPDRMVWGTDWPHPALSNFMPNDGDLLDALASYTSDARTLKKILTDNPAQLYDF